MNYVAMLSERQHEKWMLNKYFTYKTMNDIKLKTNRIQSSTLLKNEDLKLRYSKFNIYHI